MTEFPVDAERRGPSPAFVNTIVYLNPKRHKRESCIILTNVFAEPIGPWCRCCEEVGKVRRWGRHGW